MTKPDHGLKRVLRPFRAAPSDSAPPPNGTTVMNDTSQTSRTAGVPAAMRIEPMSPQTDDPRSSPSVRCCVCACLCVFVRVRESVRERVRVRVWLCAIAGWTVGEAALAVGAASSCAARHLGAPREA